MCCSATSWMVCAPPSVPMSPESGLDTAAIRAAADRLADTLVRHRRYVHRHPEIGFAEHQTVAYIESELDRLGVRHRRVAGTGVVAVIGGGERCIAVRADMDAL